MDARTVNEKRRPSIQPAIVGPQVALTSRLSQASHGCMKDHYTGKRRQSRASLSEALSDLLSPIAAQRRQIIQRVQLAWPFICGPELAQCTYPSKIVDHALVVEAQDEHWCTVIGTLERGLLKKIQTVAPSIESLRTVVAQREATKSPTKERVEKRASAGPLPEADIESHLESFVDAWRARPYAGDKTGDGEGGSGR